MARPRGPLRVSVVPRCPCPPVRDPAGVIPASSRLPSCALVMHSDVRTGRIGARVVFACASMPDLLAVEAIRQAWARMVDSRWRLPQCCTMMFATTRSYLVIGDFSNRAHRHLSTLFLFTIWGITHHLQLLRTRPDNAASSKYSGLLGLKVVRVFSTHPLDQFIAPEMQSRAQKGGIQVRESRSPFSAARTTSSALHDGINLSGLTFRPKLASFNNAVDALQLAYTIHPLFCILLKTKFLPRNTSAKLPGPEPSKSKLCCLFQHPPGQLSKIARPAACRWSWHNQTFQAVLLRSARAVRARIGMWCSSSPCNRAQVVEPAAEVALLLSFCKMP